LIAFIYTTPWDNYLVYRGVWGYGDERVLGTIGYVPLEEYAFFLLQPVLTGLVLYRLLVGEAPPRLRDGGVVRFFGSLFFIAITGIGVACLLSASDSALYMGLILSWAPPVLFALWAYAGDLFWALRRPFLLAVAGPTLYLWVADRIALGLGIWHISDTYSFDIDPLGLPIEEATFFLVTNLLVVQGVLLFLFGDVVARARQD
jgi:lycopene cyclase domain-containing protein